MDFNFWLKGIFNVVTASVDVVVFYIRNFWSVLAAMLIAIYFGFQDFVFGLVTDLLCFLLDSATDFVIQWDLRFPSLGKGVENIDLPTELLAVANYYVPLLEGGILFAGYWLLAFSVWSLRHMLRALPGVF